MTKKEKAVDQYIRDKHSTDECYAYIKGWEDSSLLQSKNAYWVLALGMILGAVIMEAITLL